MRLEPLDFADSVSVAVAAKMEMLILRPPPHHVGIAPMTSASITELLREYDRSIAYTDSLVRDLSSDEIRWRPDENSSAIGWHLGHQAAVAHFMVRNLTAAEPSIDPALDALMDSATPEAARGELPSPTRLFGFRSTVSERLHLRIGNINAGAVGAPDQLRMIATGLLVAVINHEYQHSKWISEVRGGPLGHDLPDIPESEWLSIVDGYCVLS